MAERIAALKRGLPAAAALFGAVDAALRDELARVAQAGSAAIPEIAWSALTSGSAAGDFAGRVRRAGCAVVRGVFPPAQARAWDAELAAYLAHNDADRRVRDRMGAERYAARWQGGPPQMYSVYWSAPQMQARQAPQLAALRGWLNGLWNAAGQFDATAECSYADRIRRRSPGDATLGLGPHIDGGTIGRWLGRGAQPYRHVFEGGDFDPFDAAYRTEAAEDDANGCSVFRTWQGWTALTAQGPGDGTLQVLPVARAIAWVLLRPFAPDVPPDSLCGAEAASALWLSPQWHAPLLRALVPIPRVEPGDTVWWHPDVIHAVEAVHGGSGPSNVMYIPAAPDCARNRGFLGRQAKAFLVGDSPPDFPPDHLEREFAGRAGPDALTALGRRQMGLG